jgi:phospholipid transport system transporter-binding protein
MNALNLPPILMQQQANACRDQWVQAMQASPSATDWVANAAALVQFDSSAIAVLLSCRREAFAFGQTFQVQNLPPKLQELATLYGVMALLSA